MYVHISDPAPLGESLGITPTQIRNIVYRFYEKVQNDELLGPVFESEMKETWEKHLPKMCNFWETVMFSKPLYHGNPLAAHAAVPAIQSEHFDRWLILFNETLNEVCTDQAQVAAFNSKANNMRMAMSRALGINT